MVFDGFTRWGALSSRNSVFSLEPGLGNGADIDIFMAKIVVENRGFVTKRLSIPYAELKRFPSIDDGIGAVNIAKVVISYTSVPHVVPQRVFPDIVPL